MTKHDYTNLTSAVGRVLGACAHDELSPQRPATEEDFRNEPNDHQNHWGNIGWPLWKCAKVEMCKKCGKVGKLEVDHQFDETNLKEFAVGYAGSAFDGPSDEHRVTWKSVSCTRCGTYAFRD